MTQPWRSLVICPHDPAVVGGIPRYADTLGRVLSSLGPVRHNSLGGDGGALRVRRAHRHLGGVIRLLGQALRHRDAVIHAVTWRSAVPLLIVPGVGQRLVVHALGTEVRRAGRLGARLQSAVSRRATAHVAISRFTADTLRMALGIDARVIPPALARTGVPIERDPAASPVTVLSVGRLVERKGHLDLVEAVEAVRRSGVDMHLVIAGGTGPLASALRIAAASLDWFTLIENPSDDELDGLYRSADVFGLLSRDVAGQFEGFGIVFLEAASWGLPVVAGRSGGTGDAVRHGSTGLITSNVAEAGAALALLANDGRRRAAMGAAGQRLAEEHSIAAIADEFRALHGQIGAGPQAR